VVELYAAKLTQSRETPILSADCMKKERFVSFSYSGNNNQFYK